MIATFLIDSFLLLPLSAFFLVSLSFLFYWEKYSKEFSKVIFWQWVFYVVWFWIGAGGLYFNFFQMTNLPLVGDWFAQFGDANNFMWNFERNCWYWAVNESLAFWRWRHLVPFYGSLPSYLDFWSLKNILGILWILFGYPLILAFFVELRSLLLGRSPKQVGLAGNF